MHPLIVTTVLSWPLMAATPNVTPPPFQPTDVAGLKLWLRPGVGIYQDTGATTPATADTDPVALWQDQSGQGNHFSTANSSERFQLKTAQTPNGSAALLSDGVDDRLDSNNFFTSGWTDGHIFTVVKAAADPPPGGTNRGTLYRFGASTTETDYPFTDSVIYAGFLGNSAWNAVNPAPSLSSAFRVFEEHKTGGNLTTILDASTISGPSARATASNGPILGFSGTAGIFGSHYFVSILVYDSVLSGADLTNVRTYLATL